jgi:hypothetical protein
VRITDIATTRKGETGFLGDSFFAIFKFPEVCALPCVLQTTCVRHCQLKKNPNVAKAGGLQSQGVKVEIVVGYIDPLTTQDLKSSGFPVG